MTRILIKLSLFVFVLTSNIDKAKPVVGNFQRVLVILLFFNN